MGITIQDVLKDAADSFLSTHRLPPFVRRAVHRLRRCRTAELGGHVRRCPHGHIESVHYNSCKHRSCPQCSWIQIERWLCAEKQRLLDCPHFHVIFTMPAELRALWRYNRVAFGNVLFQAAAQSLLELLADTKYLGARPGLLLALHTWTKQLTLHPHIHALVTGGGLAKDGCWKNTRDGWLLPMRVLMHKYRGKLRALLLAALSQGKLRLPPGVRPAQLRGLLNRLGRLRLNVKILERYDHGQGVVTYLARYLRGGPMANRRLVACRDGQVYFRYPDRRADADNPPTRVQGLPVMQFLLRYFQHVPPKGFTMVRRYGLYANSKREALTVARQQLGQSPRIQAALPTWTELIERLGLPVRTHCPVCGAALICEDLDAPIPLAPQPLDILSSMHRRLAYDSSSLTLRAAPGTWPPRRPLNVTPPLTHPRLRRSNNGVGPQRPAPRGHLRS